jgi:hypothetical protein
MNAEQVKFNTLFKAAKSNPNNLADLALTLGDLSPEDGKYVYELAQSDEVLELTIFWLNLLMDLPLRIYFGT